MKLIWGKEEAGYFFAGGLDGADQLERAREIGIWAQVELAHHVPTRWSVTDDRSKPTIAAGFSFAGSNAECALVGEERGFAACVHEDDILVRAPTPLTDQGDQAREPLARINRIKRESFEPARKSDRFDGSLVRNSVGRPRMPCDDFYPGFVERNIEQIGRFPRQRDDIGSHPHGLGIDIDPDDPCVWHCRGRADDETRLRAAASGAVNDRSWREARLRRL